MTQLYDAIGVDYARLRQPDPRIAAQISDALEDARTVLNVGAGAGSYEPEDRRVIAIEPSMTMIAQRPATAAPAVRGRAEALPFADDSFDAAMAVLTIHHWTDQPRGAREMRRVAREKVVLLTFDPAFDAFWLFDYFPALAVLDKGQTPALGAYATWLGPVDIAPVPIPQDCRDGFLAAYWRRPEAYLDPRLRAAMSSFRAIGDVSAGVAALAADLESGAWAERYGDLRARETLDCGYRLVVTR